MTTNILAAFAALLIHWPTVESGNRPFVRNGDCLGAYQQRPRFAQDCNRILGYERFIISPTFDYRLSPSESRTACWVWFQHYGKRWIRRDGTLDVEAVTLAYYSGVEGGKKPGPKARRHWRKVEAELNRRGR